MNNKLFGFAMSPMMIIIAIIIAGGAAAAIWTNSDDGPRDDTIQEMTGNPDIDEDALPDMVTDAFDEVNRGVSVTENCSTDAVSAAIPADWQCRKLDRNAKDFTLYTDKNTLNVSIGSGQGRTSCDVIPGCTQENIDLSSKFSDMVQYGQPMGTIEIVGTFKDNPLVKVYISSNDLLSESEVVQIKEILNSVESI